MKDLTPKTKQIVAVAQEKHRQYLDIEKEVRMREADPSANLHLGWSHVAHARSEWWSARQGALESIARDLGVEL